MATINDPQVIRFVNSDLRRTCDQLLSSLRTMRQLSSNYSANGLGSLVAGSVPLQQSFIADGSINADGSKGDGRTPILGYDVDLAVNQMNALIAYINGQAGMEAALTKPSVNITPLF